MVETAFIAILTTTTLGMVTHIITIMATTMATLIIQIGMAPIFIITIIAIAVDTPTTILAAGAVAVVEAEIDIITTIIMDTEMDTMPETTIIAATQDGIRTKEMKVGDQEAPFTREGLHQIMALEKIYHIELK